MALCTDRCTFGLTKAVFTYDPAHPQSQPHRVASSDSQMQVWQPYTDWRAPVLFIGKRRRTELVPWIHESSEGEGQGLALPGEDGTRP